MGEGAPGLAHLLSTAEHGVRSSSDEEVVILTQVNNREREPRGGGAGGGGRFNQTSSHTYLKAGTVMSSSGG